MKQYEIKYGYWTGLEIVDPIRRTNFVTLAPPDLNKSYAWAGRWIEMDDQVVSDTIDSIELENAKSQKLNAIDNRTSSEINVGYVYANKTFSASANHQTWATGMLIMAQNGQDFTGTIVPTIDNKDSYIIIDNADAITLAETCMGHVKVWLASGSVLKSQIQAATTVLELDAIIDNR
jgi:predicted aspartyl protease